MTTIEEKQLVLDKRYLRMARIWAENSYCERRKVGALIVKDKSIISDGYNGTPVLHAEANAITKLASSTNDSSGATVYVTDAPCIECAKLIIQSRIVRVVYSIEYRLRDGIDLLQRAGIIVDHIPLESL